MDDHRWALKVWETERKRQAYTLIHADHHWDGCYEFRDKPVEEKKLLAASPAQVAALVADGEWIGFDSFIAPAIRRGLIHTVHFYCIQENGRDNALDLDLLQSCSARQFIHPDASSLASATIDGPSLFDLCLDLFNRSDKWEEGDLWSDSDVIDFMNTVRPLIRALCALVGDALNHRAPRPVSAWAGPGLGCVWPCRARGTIPSSFPHTTWPRL